MTSITEDDYDDLDLPFSSIDSQIVAIADILDIDPIQFIDAYDSRVDSINLPDLVLSHGAKDVKVLSELLDLAMNSSTELPHIRAGIEYLLSL